MLTKKPSIVVLSTLFPSSTHPNLGIFIQQRMFRVAKKLPITIVSPQPWFPGQSLLRRFRPGFRPVHPSHELHEGIEIFRPHFFSIPFFFRNFDAFFIAIGSYWRLHQLKRDGRLDILDAHFAYPDGCATALLARWLSCPFTITLRGTEARHIKNPTLRKKIQNAFSQATKIFSVSDSLRKIALELNTPESKTQTIGNGVDDKIFYRVARELYRKKLGISLESPVLISVGGLVERKGFHRVIDCLPELKKIFPDLQYVIVGGASPEGDWSDRLRAQVNTLGLADCVHFTGPLPLTTLREPLSCADVFVLATRNEGWANVFLEAMACGLPVVTTQVGGNQEVVCEPTLGITVPFGEHHSLLDALKESLHRKWSRDTIIKHAQSQSWESRVEMLVSEFVDIAKQATNHSSYQ